MMPSTDERLKWWKEVVHCRRAMPTTDNLADLAFAAGLIQRRCRWIIHYNRLELDGILEKRKEKGK